MLHLDRVTPGGLKDYVERARKFLEDSKNNVNPFDQYKPEVPHGFDLKPGDALFDEMEELGLQELSKVGFVLIAGGLGERLGYSDIKITLPVTIVQDDYMYIKFYARYIKAIEDRVARELNDPEFRVPFCIMTSDDTNDKTVAVLQHGNYFGLHQD